MSELTAKQQRFIDEYPKDFNATQAAIRAGYSAKSAGVMACRLLKNTQVSQEIEKRMGEIEQKNDVEVGEIILGLRNIAFGPKATNADRLRALDLLGKHKAIWTERHVFETGERQRELDEHEKQEARWIAQIRLQLPCPPYAESQDVAGGARIAPVIEAETVETAEKQEGNKPGTTEQE